MRNFAGFDTAEVGLGDFSDAVGIVGGIGSAAHRSDDGKSPCQSLERGLFEQKMCPGNTPQTSCIAATAIWWIIAEPVSAT